MGVRQTACGRFVVTEMEWTTEMVYCKFVLVKLFKLAVSLEIVYESQQSPNAAIARHAV